MSTIPTRPLALERMGMYVVVSDLQRADRFYRSLFRKPPYLSTDRVAAFDLAGGAFVLFAEWASDIRRVRGNSAVPYLRVPDIDAAFEEIRQAEVRLVDEHIVREGPISLFRVLDPDDNLLEFFAVAPPPSDRRP